MYNLIFKVQKAMVVFAAVVGLLIAVPGVLAHVAVKPSQVGVGAFQTFTVGVPNEKEVPTVAVRLVIPEGLGHVTPNVKPGWTISVSQTGEGEEAKITEISWTGSSIPSGQRDEFSFSAQSPRENTQLIWQAYQTYQTGEVVAWDQPPNTPKAAAGSSDDEEGLTPYSTTKVVNDLQLSAAPIVNAQSPVKSENRPLVFSAGALLVAFAALGISLRKKS